MNVNGELDVGGSIFSSAGREKKKREKKREREREKGGEKRRYRDPAAPVCKCTASERSLARSCLSVNVGGWLLREGVEVFLDDTV